VILLFVIGYIFKEYFIGTLLLFTTIIALFGFVNTLFTYYLVNENDLQLNSLVKKIVIPLKKIQFVVNRQAGSFVKESVGVYGDEKRISITTWTQNYEGLIKIIIEECKTNEEIKIESELIEKYKL
jgi:hypothetical protein